MGAPGGDAAPRPPVRVRPAEPGDEDQVAASRLAAGWHAEVVPGLFASMLEGTGVIVIAEVGGVAVGSIFLDLVTGPPWLADGVTTLHLRDLVVHADHQRRGIAAQLVRRAEEEAVARGFVAATIASDEGVEHTRRLFERLGYREFRQVPEEGRYYRKALDA